MFREWKKHNLSSSFRLTEWELRHVICTVYPDFCCEKLSTDFRRSTATFLLSQRLHSQKKTEPAWMTRFIHWQKWSSFNVENNSIKITQFFLDVCKLWSHRVDTGLNRERTEKKRCFSWNRTPEFNIAKQKQKMAKQKKTAIATSAFHRSKFSSLESTILQLVGELKTKFTIWVTHEKEKKNKYPNKWSQVTRCKIFCTSPRFYCHIPIENSITIKHYWKG